MKVKVKDSDYKEEKKTDDGKYSITINLESGKENKLNIEVTPDNNDYNV